MPPRQRYQEFDPNSQPPGDTGDPTDGPGPIGVPEDYPIPGVIPGPGQRPGEHFMGERPKGTGRYMDGDEFLPANWNAAQIYMLQQQLVKAGLLNSNFPRGVWDPATMAAYRDLLAIANAKGVEAQQALAEAVISTETLGYESEPRAPLVTQTTDPSTLRQVFRRAVIELRGEGWNADQINSMVQAYNQLEIERQTQAYDMQATGGNVEAIPSPEDFIEAQVREQDPGGVAEEESLGFINDFMSMAGGQGWSA